MTTPSSISLFLQIHPKTRSSTHRAKTWEITAVGLMGIALAWVELIFAFAASSLECIKAQEWSETSFLD